MQSSLKLKTAASLLELNNVITTDNKLLDKHLHGGIQLQKVTELVGKPGAGKTQLCMKLCLLVQLPAIVGGLAGQALYIDTRQCFDPHRLKELANKIIGDYNLAVHGFRPDQMLQNVRYVECLSAGRLIANIIALKEYLQANPMIKLVIVDSLSFTIRMLTNVIQRTALLVEIHEHFQFLMSSNNISIVITNQLVVKGFCRRRKRAGEQEQTHKMLRLETTLGQKHSHFVDKRIWLSEDKYFIGKTCATKRLCVK
ncbi:DNA repair protein RAD51 homolog 3 [Drosophila busckii]|uniref:DNA repair protein RAD51 homolog 3 n=1 Tax=Drosophila busckii TaxID=30019 RepID=UPI00083EB114|nr:DNA repair protein RAD51 homolog 3 [Drosophila busckii]